MSKNIGFNRNVKLDWLDAAAAFVSETNDLLVVRDRLGAIMPNVSGIETKRKNIDILVNIWLKSKDLAPSLYEEAKALYSSIIEPADRIWLHFGLTLVYYPYFREVAMLVGQTSRNDDEFTKIMVKERLISLKGELGSLERSLRYVLSSMKDWGILSEGKNQSIYIPNRRAFSTQNQELEAWFLACALFAHPATVLPFDDLVRLPELFAFKFTVTVDSLRKGNYFEIFRQGAGLNMVANKD